MVYYVKMTAVIISGTSYRMEDSLIGSVDDPFRNLVVLENHLSSERKHEERFKNSLGSKMLIL